MSASLFTKVSLLEDEAGGRGGKEAETVATGSRGWGGDGSRAHGWIER